MEGMGNDAFLEWTVTESNYSYHLRVGSPGKSGKVQRLPVPRSYLLCVVLGDAHGH